MRNLKNEFRLYMAEVLLYWALCIVPDTYDGQRMKNAITYYVIDGLKQPKKKKAK